MTKEIKVKDDKIIKVKDKEIKLDKVLDAILTLTETATLLLNKINKKKVKKNE